MGVPRNRQAVIEHDEQNLHFVPLRVVHDATLAALWAAPARAIAIDSRADGVLVLQERGQAAHSEQTSSPFFSYAS